MPLDLGICKYLLGAEVFKKYWPGSGSYWRDTHISSGSKKDLESLMRESKQRLGNLLQTISYEILLVGSAAYFGKLEQVMENDLTYVIGVPVLIVQGAKLMVIYYNMRKATLRINEIEKVKDRDINEEYMDTYNEDQILIVQKKLNFYRIVIDEVDQQIGPFFQTLEEALSFRRFAIAKAGDSKIKILQTAYRHTIQNTYYNSLFCEWRKSVEK